MTLFEFKKKVLNKDLKGLYILSGPETYLKNQYVNKISEDFNLVKVKNFNELTRRLGKKSLTSNGTKNLLLYIETIKDIDMNTLKFDGNEVIIIVTLDDKRDDIIYFGKLNNDILSKYTKSPLLKYRSQIEIVHSALKILNKSENDILDVGLAEIEFKAPTPEEYSIAIILGDKKKLIRYNYILEQLGETPYLYLTTLYDMLTIYELFLNKQNVFEGTNEAYTRGLSYVNAKRLREQFCRPKTEEEKRVGYGNWKNVRSLIKIDCIKIRKEVLDILLNNYMFYEYDIIFNYLAFCL